MVEDEFVFALPDPEECRLPTLPDVIPGICSIRPNAVIARYGLDSVFRIFSLADDVTARSASGAFLRSRVLKRQGTRPAAISRRISSCSAIFLGPRQRISIRRYIRYSNRGRTTLIGRRNLELVHMSEKSPNR